MSRDPRSGPHELSALLKELPPETLERLAPTAFGAAVRRWQAAGAAGKPAGPRTPRWVSAV